MIYSELLEVDPVTGKKLDYAEVAKGLEEKLRGRVLNPKKIIYKLTHDQGPLKAGSKVAEGFVDYGWTLIPQNFTVPNPERAGHQPITVHGDAVTHTNVATTHDK